MEYDPSGTEEVEITGIEGPEVEDVEEETDQEVEPELEYDLDDPNSANLVEIFVLSREGREALERVGAKVVLDYDSATEGSDERRSMIADSWKLFTGMIPTTRDYPYPGAPNPHVPLMMIQLMRLFSQLYGELFKDWHNIFGVKPVGGGEDAEKIAEILRKHGNWQIRNQIKDFKRQMARMVLKHLVVGDTVIHSYWSEQTLTNRHEVLNEDNFVVPFSYTSTMPDFSDCPFLVKLLHYYRHELEQMRGIWYGVEETLKGKVSWDEEPEEPLADEAKAQQRVDVAEDTEGPRKILWYEGWMAMPKHPRQRYMKAIVDYKTKNVLSLTLHEKPKWEDRARYDRQLKEKEMYGQAVEQWQRAQIAEKEADLAAMQQGVDPEVARQTGMMPPRGPAEEPQMPGWMSNETSQPEPMLMEPIRLFTHLVFIEPFEGNLGFSIGSVAAHFNLLSNTVFSQFVDQATRANTKSFLTGEGPMIPEKIKIQPNGIVKIRGIPASEISKAMIPLEFGPANPQMQEIIAMTMKWAEEAFQSPAVLGGAPGKSGEAYRGLVARLEQATKQLSHPAGQLSDALEDVLKKNGELNAMFLEDEELIEITDGILGAENLIQVGAGMYRRGYAVEITSDKRFTTQAERIAEADESFGMAKAAAAVFGPQPPVLKMIKAAIVKAFDARGMRDMTLLAGQIAEMVPPPQGAPGQPQPGGNPPKPSQPGAKGGPPAGASRAPEPQPGQAPGRIPAPATPGAPR